MAFTPFTATNGNWSLASLAGMTPTATNPNATKTVTVGNYNFATDFSVKKNDSTECELVSTQHMNGNIRAGLSVRFCSKDIQDVYSSLHLKATPLSNKQGQQIMVSTEELLHVTNAITGEEGDLPLTLWTCIRVPSHVSITADVLSHALTSHLGALFACDDNIGKTLITALANNDLNPNS